ncbi:DNA topoisomerase IB [Bradyrhizobium sp. GM7.3]
MARKSTLSYRLQPMLATLTDAPFDDPDWVFEDKFDGFRMVAEKRNVVAAIESVSKQLGNTPAICRKCYVHPEVLNAYMSGDLVKMIEAKIAQKFKRQYAKLTSDEIMVLAFLRKRLDSLKAPA